MRAQDWPALHWEWNEGDTRVDPARGSAGKALAEPARDGVEGDALLELGVPVADGDGLVGEGIAVDGEAEGAAGLVHA